MMSPYLRRRGAAEGSVWAVSPKGRGKNGHEYPYLRHEFLAGVYDREFPVNQLAVTPPPCSAPPPVFAVTKVSRRAAVATTAPRTAAASVPRPFSYEGPEREEECREHQYKYDYRSDVHTKSPAIK